MTSDAEAIGGIKADIENLKEGQDVIFNKIDALSDSFNKFVTRFEVHVVEERELRVSLGKVETKLIEHEKKHKEFDEKHADIERLKARGWGILAGVSLAGGGATHGISALLKKLGWA